MGVQRGQCREEYEYESVCRELIWIVRILITITIEACGVKCSEHDDNFRSRVPVCLRALIFFELYLRYTNVYVLYSITQIWPSLPGISKQHKILDQTYEQRNGTQHGHNSKIHIISTYIGYDIDKHFHKRCQKITHHRIS